MEKLEAWLKAFRLRTLPLSLSSIILGSLLAHFRGAFELFVMISAMVTTLFLQILSNLANDYGDMVSGVDNDERTGPKRGLQTGIITLKSMRVAIAIFSLLSLASGLWLVLKASRNLTNVAITIFIILGLLAIAAAINYTMGKRPYGYRGFGDLFVFAFFGITAVLGTFFLQTHKLEWPEVLPAISMGFLATGVLNLNNMRDYENDKKAGKRTLVVILGEKRAHIYHAVLIIGALVFALLYNIIRYQSSYQFLFLFTAPLLIQNVIVVLRNTIPSELDAELKKLALATLIFAVTFGVGLIY